MERISSPARAARVFSFSFVAIFRTSPSYVSAFRCACETRLSNRLCVAGGCRNSITQYLEKTVGKGRAAWGMWQKRGKRGGRPVWGPRYGPREQQGREKSGPDIHRPPAHGAYSWRNSSPTLAQGQTQSSGTFSQGCLGPRRCRGRPPRVVDIAADIADVFIHHKTLLCKHSVPNQGTIIPACPADAFMIQCPYLIVNRGSP